MARAAKAYVLGQPFQSHRAAQRMTQAVNIYTERLRAALSENFCPFPVIEDKTVGACVEGGHCGCGNRAALGSVIAPIAPEGKTDG